MGRAGMGTYAIVPFPKVCDEGFCHGADGVVADKADDAGNLLQGFVYEREGREGEYGDFGNEERSFKRALHLQFRVLRMCRMAL